MKELNMENANDHPFKVSIVKDAEFFANSHPYKVSIEGGGGGGNEGRVVDELPEEGEPGYIYLVLKEHTPEGDIYDEYMWVLLQDGETHGWERIGATNEIKTGGPTILTTADYNWNSVNKSTSGTLDSFALWLLDDGMYAFESGIPISKVKCDKDNSVPGGSPSSTRQAPTILVLSSVDVWNRPIKTFIGSADMGGNPPGQNAFFVIGTGTDGTAHYNRGSGTGQYGLTRGDVVDNLTTADGATLPLSAAQGKVLNDKIGQIETILQAITTGNGV